MKFESFINITDLAPTTAVTAVENEIPSVSNLVCSPKISEIENKNNSIIW